MTKRNKEALEVDGCVYYLDSGDGFTGAHMCQSVSDCTLKICSIPHVNYTSIKLFFKSIRICKMIPD